VAAAAAAAAMLKHAQATSRILRPAAATQQLQENVVILGTHQ
jgi:hypothetical protein